MERDAMMRRIEADIRDLRTKGFRVVGTNRVPEALEVLFHTCWARDEPAVRIAVGGVLGLLILRQDGSNQLALDMDDPRCKGVETMLIDCDAGRVAGIIRPTKEIN